MRASSEDMTETSKNKGLKTKNGDDTTWEESNWLHSYFTESCKYSKMIFVNAHVFLVKTCLTCFCSHLNHHLPNTGSPPS